MLDRETTALLIIDVQGALAREVQNHQELIQNIQKCIRGVQVLGVPLVWLEQYPQGLGATVAEIAELLPDQQPISKTTFSCCGSKEIVAQLQRLGSKQLLVCGIETHVCVYQSVIELLENGYQVEVIADAVSSRTELNREIGLQKMQDSGAALTSTEMCLFELTRDSRSKLFKDILKIVR